MGHPVDTLLFTGRLLTYNISNLLSPLPLVFSGRSGPKAPVLFVVSGRLLCGAPHCSTATSLVRDPETGVPRLRNIVYIVGGCPVALCFVVVKCGRFRFWNASAFDIRFYRRAPAREGRSVKNRKETRLIKFVKCCVWRSVKGGKLDKSCRIHSNIRCRFAISFTSSINNLVAKLGIDTTEIV